MQGLHKKPAAYDDPPEPWWEDVSFRFWTVDAWRGQRNMLGDHRFGELRAAQDGEYTSGAVDARPTAFMTSSESESIVATGLGP